MICKMDCSIRVSCSFAKFSCQKFSVQFKPAPIMLEILPISYSFQNFPKILPIILLIITYYSHKILCMQVILELDDCSIRVYRSFAEHIQYSSSFSHNHLIHALNYFYQVGQYSKHHAQKRPYILKLCLRVSNYSRIILSKMFTYIILKFMPA